MTQNLDRLTLNGLREFGQDQQQWLDLIWLVDCGKYEVESQNKQRCSTI